MRKYLKLSADHEQTEVSLQVNTEELDADQLAF